LIERLRAKGVNARKAMPEEKAERRLFVGKPPVAKPREERSG
jgi:hypothetical protein